MLPGCRAVGAALTLAACSVGCAGNAPPERQGAIPPIRSKDPPRERWGRFDEARGWPELGTGGYPSTGHEPPRYLARPRLPEADRATYAALVSDSEVRVGFLATLWHREKDTGAPGPVYVMEKQPSGWRFTALGPDGYLLGLDAGLCARCHAEAPHDHLFGLPRLPERPSQTE